MSQSQMPRVRRHSDERDEERKMFEQMTTLHARSRQNDLTQLEKLQRTMEAIMGSYDNLNDETRQ